MRSPRLPSRSGGLLIRGVREWKGGDGREESGDGNWARGNPPKVKVSRISTDCRCVPQAASSLQCRATCCLYMYGTGVNPAGDAGDTSPQYFGWGGRQREYPRQYYYVLLDIADQYWLPSVCSASSRFHSAIRRHQFASVRQADSRLTRLVPPTLNSRWRHCMMYVSTTRLVTFVVRLPTEGVRDQWRPCGRVPCHRLIQTTIILLSMPAPCTVFFSIHLLNIKLILILSCELQNWSWGAEGSDCTHDY